MINYTPQLIMPTGNLVNAGVFYELDAKYISNNQPAQPQPGQHYTIFVKYQEDISANLNENNLALYYWNGSAWVREWTSRVDSETNTVVASPNHFSLWAVLGSDGQSIYLPIIFKAR